MRQRVEYSSAGMATKDGAQVRGILTGGDPHKPQPEHGAHRAAWAELRDRPPTLRAYMRDPERPLLWRAVNLQKSPSSPAVEDYVTYRYY
jgi:hypothetical protein